MGCHAERIIRYRRKYSLPVDTFTDDDVMIITQELNEVEVPDNKYFLEEVKSFKQKSIYL
jgi:hypothetical protein